MRCEDLVTIIIDYLEGNMNPILKEEFERHIGDCSPCHAFFATYKKTQELTGKICCEEIPVEVKERLKDFLKNKMSQD